MVWIDCKVQQTGSNEDGNVYIALKGSGKDDTGKIVKVDAWYVAAKCVKNEMLATAIAAINTGNTVEVGFGSVDPYSQISAIYLRK